MRELLRDRRHGRLTLALIAGLFLLAFAATPVLASAPAPDKSTAKFEADFMVDMTDHPAMAVMMAEMCVEKAIHEDLRSMCEEIFAIQSQEIALMQSWLQNWYGVSHEPEMKRDGMHRLMKLDGEEFEIVFIEMMIKHHLRAIQEGEKCLDNAYHQRLLGLCANIIVTQSAEIERMQTWLCEWYAVCNEREEA